jgi:hypothetical protein
VELTCAVGTCRLRHLSFSAGVGKAQSALYEHDRHKVGTGWCTTDFITTQEMNRYIITTCVTADY